MSTFRRDVWPSREIVAEGYKKSKFYKAWDPRVLDRQIQFGLRDLPTAIYPLESIKGSEKPVTLTTTKHQEVFTFLRPNFDGSGHNGQPVDSKKCPDLDSKLPLTYPFYRPEPPRTFYRLPEIRPSVLYIFGETSYLSSPSAIKEKLEATGSGLGGSGGSRCGRVKGVTLKQIGHLVAMEAVDQCANAASEWVGDEMQRWRKEEGEHRREWSKKTALEKKTIDAAWEEMMGGDPRTSKATAKPKL